MNLVNVGTEKTYLSISIRLKKVVASGLAGWLLLLSFFFIVAAAAHSGFFAKWSFRDAGNSSSGNRFSVEAMLDGTAHKPFVYRQLIPALANAAESVLPPQFKDYIVRRFNPNESYTRAISANQPSYAFRYRVIYTLHFLSLFLSLFLLRAVVLHTGSGEMEASFAPAAFVLAFPYLETVGGYFYDGAELAFLSAAVLAVLRRKYIVLLVLAAVATYNKESFFFFLPTLYPLLRFSMSKKKTIAVILPAMLIAGGVNFLTKMSYVGNDGGAAEFHLLTNLGNYLLPWFYRQVEVTYGMPGPHGTFFLTLIVGLLVVMRAWPVVPKVFKLHAIFCMVINFPLFVLFCATGELRNLSFLYVSFVIFLAFSIRLYSSEKKSDGPTERNSSFQ